MANEISLSLQLKVQNPAGSSAGYTQNIVQQKQFTQNLLAANAEVVTVPTTAGGTAYTFTNLTTYGFLYLQNLDAANYVEYGPDNAGALVPFGKIGPGEVAFLRLMPGITFRMMANTAAVQISYLLLND